MCHHWHEHLKSLTLPFKEFRKDSKASQTNSALTQLDVSDICESASQTGAICDALRFTRAQDTEAEALAGAPQTHSTLAQLDLSGICELKTEAICKATGSTQTQDSEAEALADPPQTNSTLTQLDSNVIWALELSEVFRLSRTKWHSEAEELADALLTNSTLTYLNLSGISDSESEAICKAMQSNHAVTDLILYESVIDSAGANSLAEALKSPDTQLTYSSLGFCLVNVDVIIEALQTNRSLTHLNLTTLDIPPSATVLAKSLQLNRTLTHLTLSYNRISNTGALLLAQTLLDQNNTLAYLDLSYNKIGDTGKAKLELIDSKRCVINLEGQF